MTSEQIDLVVRLAMKAANPDDLDVLIALRAGDGPHALADVLEGDALERLINMIRPDLVEHVWAEPYNDRANWRVVRDGYEPGSNGYEWFTRVFEDGDTVVWSRYATDLYKRLRDHAERESWLHKLRYLLYEDRITSDDARTYLGLRGVLLQSKPGDDGLSRNPYIARLQRS